MKYIKLFEEQATDLLMAELDDLERLRELGLVEYPEYVEQKSLIKLKQRTNAKDLLTAKSQHTIYSKGWFDNLRTKPEFRWLIEVIDSPEYADLVAKGAFLSSSFTQLLNHTLIFSKRVDRNIHTDFAIGFFAGVNVVKRIYPKTGYRDMDLRMKKFDASLPEIDFFKKAMAWVSTSFDFTTNNITAKRTIQSNISRQRAESEFRKVITEFIKQRLPDSDDYQIKKWSDKIQSLVGWNMLEITQATNAFRTWLTADKPAKLVVYSESPLDQEIQQLLDDPRLTVKNRAVS